MSINFVNTASTRAAAGASDASLADAPVHLTAEGLLLYCQTRLNSLDGEIKKRMEQQELNVKKKDVLAELQNELKQYNPPESKEEVAKVRQAYEKALGDLPKDDPLRKDLMAMMNACLGAVESAKTAEPCLGQSLVTLNDQFKGNVDEIGRIKDNISDNAELQMLELQSLISSRQTAVQLTTNMLSKLSQTELSTVKNI